MSASRDIYLGLMSGTSLDAVDALAIDLSPKAIDRQERVLGHHALAIPESLKAQVIALSTETEDSLRNCLELDVEIGHMFADCALELIRQMGLKNSQITAIGSHGQTIRHNPPNSLSNPSSRIHYSQQIGDPNVIAERTGIEVVADFRRRDIAAGGQAAPLAPAFHAHWFGEFEQRKVAVNIGGMANISLLESDRCTAGFDSGPGNALMDYWCQKHTDQPMDRDGALASEGKVDDQLLHRLLSADYFSHPIPKSTGRELFNAQWLEDRLTKHASVVDVQATLLELTARSITDAIGQAAPVCSEIILCGGGVYNRALFNRIQELTTADVVSCAEYGLKPEQVEAAAFAWLAKKRLVDEPGNAPAATGAKGYRILGAIYSA